MKFLVLLTASLVHFGNCNASKFLELKLEDIWLIPFYELDYSWLVPFWKLDDFRRVLYKAAMLVSKEGPNPFSFYYGTRQDPNRFHCIKRQVVLYYKDSSLARESASEDVEIVMASLLPWRAIALNNMFPTNASEWMKIPLVNPLLDYDFDHCLEYTPEMEFYLSQRLRSEPFSLKGNYWSIDDDYFTALGSQL